MEKFFEAIRAERLKTTEPDNAGGGMFLIVGLGNPGREYRDTRHNFGFMVVDRLVERLGVTFDKSQHKAVTATGFHEGNKILVAKPQTYMNLSGQSVVAILKYYKIPNDRLLVIHDDLDLPFGTLRMRPGGGAGGQKGLGSTIQQLGTQEFARLRCGIDHPTGHMSVSDYVLSKFRKEEETLLPEVLDRAVDAALAFVATGIQDAMTRYNGKIE